MTRLVILTIAALAVSSAVASAQTANTARGNDYRASQQASQGYSYSSMPLILGVAY
jgi:hypothetical protein